MGEKFSLTFVLVHESRERNNVERPVGAGVPAKIEPVAPALPALPAFIVYLFNNFAVMTFSISTIRRSNVPPKNTYPQSSRCKDALPKAKCMKGR